MEFLKIWEILLRRKLWIIAVFLAFFFAVFIGTKKIVPTYETSSKLLIKDEGGLSSLMSSLGLAESGGKSDSAVNFETRIALAKVRPVAEKLISRLELKDRDGKAMDPEDLVEQTLINKIFPRPFISIEQYEEAEMIEITAKSSDPEEAAEMANELAGLYIDASLEKTRQEFRSAREFVDRQLENVKQDYLQSLEQYRDFMVAQETLNLNEEIEQLLDKINSIESNLENNDILIVEYDNKIRSIKKELSERDLFRKESRRFAKSESVSSLENKINDLLISISSKGVELQKTHPEYRKLDKELEKTKSLLKEKAAFELNSESMGIDPLVDDLAADLVNVHINREIAAAKKEILESYLGRYKDELFEMPMKYIKDDRLNLVLSVHKSAFQELLRYRVKVGVAESLTLSNIKIAELAQPPEKPDFPKKAVNFVLAVFLGTFFALGLGLFVEYADVTVKNPEDIKHHTSFVFLGSIPKAGIFKKKRLPFDPKPGDCLTEAYRKVCSNIEHALVDKRPGSILVTSSTRREGKTTFCAHISAAMGSRRGKAVLVDLNFQNPAVHRFFLLQNTLGVTSILGQGEPLDNCVHYSVHKNLSVLTSGPAVSDASGLIESGVFSDFLSTLKKEFDIVIIDTPPLAVSADALALSRHVDSIIHVTASGKTTMPMIRNAQEDFQRAGVKFFGIVLNKFKRYAVLPFC